TNTTFSGVISGSAGNGLTKAGTGTLTLAGANTFSGGLTLSAGTLNINSATAPGTGTFTISGGTINNTSGNNALALSNNNLQSWNGDFTFTGTNNLNLGSGAVTMNASRQVTVSGGTLTVGGAISGATFGITKAGPGTLVLNGNIGTTSGAIADNAGTLTLAGANTFTGGVTLASGATLNINSATALGAAAGTFTINGGTIDNTSGSAVTLTNNNPITVGGDFTFTGSNNLNLGTGAVGLSTAGATRTITLSGTNSILTFG